MRTTIATHFILALICNHALASNLIINGSFEDGPFIPGRLLTVHAPDSSTLTGWTVANNDLEIIMPIEWPASEGSRSIDLNGVTNATMYQDITGLIPGMRYRLTFSLSGNPFINGDPIGEADSIKSLRVTSGNITNDYEFDVTPFHWPNGSTVMDMGWRLESLVFTAINSVERIQFASLDPANSTRGPAIDNVVLNLVPEPTSSTFLLTGIFTIFTRRRPTLLRKNITPLQLLT